MIHSPTSIPRHADRHDPLPTPLLGVEPPLGSVEIDRTRATFAPGVTTIDVRAFMGYVPLRLPADVHVELEGGAIAGFFALKGRGADAADTDRVVRISGRAVFGFAEAQVWDVATGNTKRRRML